MPRSSLTAFCTLLCTALAFAPGAAAKTAPTTCTIASPEAVGGSISGKLTASNVDPVQAPFATCKWAKKVMTRTAKLGVEEPRPVRSFFCRPSVNPYYVNIVHYICTFRGADTATFIKLTFEVKYKG
jgi:hypothetical protein